MGEIYSINASLDDIKQRIYIVCPFEANAIVKHVTQKWDGAKRAWWLPASPAAARALGDLMHTSSNAVLKCDAGVLELMHTADKTREAKQEFVVNAGDGETLPDLPGKVPAWGHQRKAFHWALAGDMRALLLWVVMGGGKSRIVVSLCEAWDCRMVCIQTVKKAVPVWPDQFLQHATNPDEWYVICPPEKMTIANRVKWVNREMTKATALNKRIVLVLNHEAAWRPAFAQLLMHYYWDLGVIDESHKAKAPGGTYSKFLAKWRTRVERRVCASGTPFPHSKMDAYAQFRFLDPGIFGTNYNKFKNRYGVWKSYSGDAASFEKLVDYQNEDELNKKVGSITFVAGEEVLDLPPVLHIPNIMQAGKVERAPSVFDLGPKERRAYDALKNGLILGIEDGTVTKQNALTKLLALQQCTSGYVVDDEGNLRELGTSKQDTLRELFDGIADDAPRVVFARFHHDLDRIIEVCESMGLPWGEISGRRNDALDGPRMREDIAVAVVQEQAGGTGIDLTRARFGYYYSLSHSLGDFDQSWKRLHRPGQVNPVTFWHLCAMNTLDLAIYRALRLRRDIILECMDRVRTLG